MTEEQKKKRTEKYMKKGLERLAKSASGFVLTKRFGGHYKTGLKRARDEGLVSIIETMFGRAYKLEKN